MHVTYNLKVYQVSECTKQCLALQTAGNLSGGEVNLAYELLNIQQSIDGLMSILSLFIIHVALVHVRIE